MNALVRIVTIATLVWFFLFVFGVSWYNDVTKRFFSVQDHRTGVPYVVLAIPITMAGAVGTLFLLRTPDTYHPLPFNPAIADSLATPLQKTRQWWMRGECNFDTLSFALILLPLLIYLVMLLPEVMRMDSQSRRLSVISNNLGYISVLIMGSFLLIPVARQSALTVGAFGWSHAHSIRLHVWAGWIAILTGVIHGIIYFYEWMFIRGEGFFTEISPPLGCWTVADTGFEPPCPRTERCLPCYTYFRNLTGVLAAFFFLVLAVTSLNPARRRLYGVFYLAHIISSPLAFFFTILHWNPSSLYLAGGMVFYLACSFPIWIENLFSVRRDGGVKILSFEDLSAGPLTSDRPCAVITLEASASALSRYRPGHYVRLVCPSLSSVPHPFTINSAPGEANQLRIIFRAMGPFTRQLYAALRHGNEMPILGLDGYHGTPNRVRQALLHETVLIVAGGVGITPFLSMLHRIHARLCMAQGMATTNSVILHWICREREVVDYVKRTYLDPLRNAPGDDAGFTMKLYIHHTSDPSGSEQIGSDTETGKGARTAVSKGDIDARPGIPFGSSKFAPGSRSTYRANIPLFLTFTSISVLGLLTVWYCYHHVQKRSGVLARSVSPILLVLFSAIIAVIVNVLLNRDPHDMVEATWSAAMDHTGEGGEDTELSTTTTTTANPQGSVVNHSCGLNMVSMEERQGRPDMVGILQGLDATKCTGLFVCGPDAMMEEICVVTGYSWDARRWIQKPIGSHRKVNVSLYLESYYM